MPIRRIFCFFLCLKTKATFQHCFIFVFLHAWVLRFCLFYTQHPSPFTIIGVFWVNAAEHLNLTQIEAARSNLFQILNWLPGRCRYFKDNDAIFFKEVFATLQAQISAFPRFLNLILEETQAQGVPKKTWDGWRDNMCSHACS